MDKNFKNNLHSLKQYNPLMAEMLQKLNTNQQFEAFQQEDRAIAINIYDHKRKVAIYNHPITDLTAAIEYFDIYSRYHFLYFFGIGNGYLTKSLLLRHTDCKRIVIVEPELELLYIALHLNDFSESISQQKLQLFLTDQINQNTIEKTLLDQGSVFSAKTFRFFYPTYYEEHYNHLLTTISKNFETTLEHLLLGYGNNINDNILGITQTLNNLHLFSKSPSLAEVKRARNSNLAIIISTGPSLAKQLKHLKQIAPYATLISVDASLPILELHDIKPDICVSLERDEPTSQFFIKTSSNFRKGIVFVCASVQHKTVFQILSDDVVVPVFRPHHENRFFNLNDSGYIGSGMSAANMAHDLAYEMGFPEVVLIGQDLSFAKNGATHSDGHIFDSDPDIQKEIDDNKLFEIEAYAGVGTVLTHVYWKAFLDGLSSTSHQFAHSMKTFNATEGGARIPGTEEIVFSVIAQKQINSAAFKKEMRLHALTKEEQIAIDNQIRSSLQQLLHDGKAILSALHPLLEKLKQFSIQTNEKTTSRIDSSNIENLLLSIFQMRTEMNQNRSFSTFYLPIIIPAYFDNELEFSTINQTYYENEYDRNVEMVKIGHSILQTIALSTHTLLTLLKERTS